MADSPPKMKDEPPSMDLMTQETEEEMVVAEGMPEETVEETSEEPASRPVQVPPPILSLDDFFSDTFESSSYAIFGSSQQPSASAYDCIRPFSRYAPMLPHPEEERVVAEEIPMESAEDTLVKAAEENAPRPVRIPTPILSLDDMFSTIYQSSSASSLDSSQPQSGRPKASSHTTAYVWARPFSPTNAMLPHPEEEMVVAQMIPDEPAEETLVKTAEENAPRPVRIPTPILSLDDMFSTIYQSSSTSSLASSQQLSGRPEASSHTTAYVWARPFSPTNAMLPHPEEEMVVAQMIPDEPAEETLVKTAEETVTRPVRVSLPILSLDDIHCETYRSSSHSSLDSLQQPSARPDAASHTSSYNWTRPFIPSVAMSPRSEEEMVVAEKMPEESADETLEEMAISPARVPTLILSMDDIFSQMTRSPTSSSLASSQHLSSRSEASAYASAYDSVRSSSRPLAILPRPEEEEMVVAEEMPEESAEEALMETILEMAEETETTPVRVGTPILTMDDMFSQISHTPSTSSLVSVQQPSARSDASSYTSAYDYVRPFSRPLPMLPRPWSPRFPPHPPSDSPRDSVVPPCPFLTPSEDELPTPAPIVVRASGIVEIQIFPGCTPPNPIVVCPSPMTVPKAPVSKRPRLAYPVRRPARPPRPSSSSLIPSALNRSSLDDEHSAQVRPRGLKFSSLIQSALDRYSPAADWKPKQRPPSPSSSSSSHVLSARDLYDQPVDPSALQEQSEAVMWPIPCNIELLASAPIPIPPPPPKRATSVCRNRHRRIIQMAGPGEVQYIPPELLNFQYQIGVTQTIILALSFDEASRPFLEEAIQKMRGLFIIWRDVFMKVVTALYETFEKVLDGRKGRKRRIRTATKEMDRLRARGEIPDERFVHREEMQQDLQYLTSQLERYVMASADEMAELHLYRVFPGFVAVQNMNATRDYFRALIQEMEMSREDTFGPIDEEEEEDDEEETDEEEEDDEKETDEKPNEEEGDDD